MAGYRYRALCTHRGSIYDPGAEKVVCVACPSCKAAPRKPCVDGVGRRMVAPHARRYLAHHDATCPAMRVVHATQAN